MELEFAILCPIVNTSVFDYMCQISFKIKMYHLFNEISHKQLSYFAHIC